MQKWIGIGNLTKDPELATTNNGKNYCRFTLAIPRKYTNENNEKVVDFINCLAWNSTAENCNQYLKKGSKACVVGSLQTRSYDAQDGSKRYVSEIVCENVEFLSSKSQMQNNYGEPTPPPENQYAELQPIDDDDENMNLPF